ncbi:AAA family ATPase [Tumebacillus algifaecis]|uniref:AAA family ATPase n=1 Tax=Tumebacillus algifaecis TaxID=1214604 RepID=UPI0012FE1E30|nr:AAA family ATPase [Tumebacillus algifaecis]
MPQLTSLFFDNFKGSTSNFPLSKKTVLVGPNGSGKTTHVQALNAAMLGYIPGNGKQPGDTFKMSSDQQIMSAGLELDNGFGFIRSFERTLKSSKGVKKPFYSQSIELSPSRGEQTETERKARIAEEVGSLSMMLDFSAFTEMTASGRRDFIYSLAGGEEGEGWNKQRINSYLQEQIGKIDDPDLAKELANAVDDALGFYEDTMTIDEGLAAMKGFVERELSVSKDKAKNAAGAIKTLTQQKNELQETDRNLDVNKRELADLREQLLKTEKQLAADREKKKAIDRRTARLNEVAALIERQQAVEKQPTDQVDKQIAELEEAMDHSDDSTEHRTLVEKKTELATRINDTQQKIGHARQERSRLIAERGSIQSTLDTIQNNAGVCVIQNLIKCPKDFSSYVVHAQQQVAQKDEEIAAFNESERAMLQALSQENAEMAEIEQRMNSIMSRVNQRQRENAQRQQQIKQLQAQKSSIQQAEEKRLGDLQRAMQEQQDLRDQPIEAIAPLDMLEAQITNLGPRMKELAEKVEQQSDVRNKIQNIQQAILTNQVSEIKKKAFEKLNEALGPKGVQGEIVKTMLDPMRADIEVNLRAIGIGAEIFFQTESDTGQEVFDFGWQIGEERRMFDALSTGQQIMTLIAFLVAVIERAKPPVRVLALDNIENLDGTNLRNLFTGLDALADKLDNIIVAGVLPYKRGEDEWLLPGLPESWSLHVLGEELQQDQAFPTVQEGVGESDDLPF